jgi:hypothetical protein
MTTIRRIVLPYGTHPAMVDDMLQDTVFQPRRAARLAREAVDETRTSPWQSWRPNRPRQMPVLSVAELAECTCPAYCDRDHANE